MASSPTVLPERSAASPARCLVLGATGTAGRASVAALLRAGHEVVCAVRDPQCATLAFDSGTDEPANRPRLVRADATRAASLRHVFTDASARGEPIGAVVSALASRTGAPNDAWAIDYRANALALQAARGAGVHHFVFVSAICVQRPLLAFQHAKLAFERALAASGLRYSIVRPTAFFKSLSGQVERVRRGKPFLVFGDGRRTVCLPISDRDLGEFVAGCLIEPERWNRILPIGGPGKPITPLDQAKMLHELLGRPTRIRRVPIGLLDTIVATLDLAGRLDPRAQAKADLARIGRYYATQSMLALDPQTQDYFAEATPATGADTLRDHYERLLRGEASHEAGEHSVFARPRPASPERSASLLDPA